MQEDAMRITNHIKFAGLGRVLSRAANRLARPRLGDRDERMLKDLGISPAQADWVATHRVTR
jgi:uncharacterized protein YjiS (DUF1127 family)